MGRHGKARRTLKWVNGLSVFFAYIHCHLSKNCRMTEEAQLMK